MVQCQHCGKEFNILFAWSPKIGKLKGLKFCSRKCLVNFKNNSNDESIKLIQKNLIKEKTYQKAELLKKNEKLKEKKILKKNYKISKKNVEIEIECTCLRCNNKWYYSEKEEKNLKLQSGANALIGLGALGSPLCALFSNKSIDSQRELSKLTKCPKCGSSHIKKEKTEFEKTN